MKNCCLCFWGSLVEECRDEMGHSGAVLAVVIRDGCNVKYKAAVNYLHKYSQDLKSCGYASAAIIGRVLEICEGKPIVILDSS